MPTGTGASPGRAGHALKAESAWNGIAFPNLFSGDLFTEEGASLKGAEITPRFVLPLCAFLASPCHRNNPKILHFALESETFLLFCYSEWSETSHSVPVTPYSL